MPTICSVWISAVLGRDTLGVIRCNCFSLTNPYRGWIRALRHPWLRLSQLHRITRLLSALFARMQVLALGVCLFVRNAHSHSHLSI